MPSHIAARDFPRTADALGAFDCVILSDIGANTLLLHPDTFTRSRPLPNRLDGIRDYVAAGGGLVMVGGYMTFQGIEGKARYAGTAGRRRAAGDALAATTTGSRCRRASPRKSPLPATRSAWAWAASGRACWATTASPPSRARRWWPRWASDVLIVAGSYGTGRSVAFTSDCGPHWAPPSFVEWVGYARLWDQIVSWTTGRP